jgi:hypothetical protein
VIGGAAHRSLDGGYGAGANEEGRRRGAPPECGCPFIGSGGGWLE